MTRETRIEVTSRSWLTTRALHAFVFLAPFFASTTLAAQDREEKKLASRAERAAQVLTELVSIPDRAPPRRLLSEATCVAVLPGVIQAGLEIGGRVGHGLASCRTRTGWSLPTFVSLEGASVGLQIGVERSDIVLFFMNENAAQRMSSTFHVGGDASVAAGPIGRSVSAATNVKLQSEIYSYSKSKGAFAGVALSGTRWGLDYDDNRAAYAHSPASVARGGDAESVDSLLVTGAARAPSTVRPFVESLEKNVGPGRNRSP
jgi:lipid-binding SYLF domain-containing protein